MIAAHRAYLFGMAYRMLGSTGDAEDVVQEAFLRWHEATAAGTLIERDRAWLTTVVTRLSLDQLRSARVQREQYVGPWLPEPLVGNADDVADDVIRAETLSTAFLMVLERLSPRERAIFLLHDVFGYEFATIASMVGVAEANCRQIARRARAHIEDGRPRFQPPPAEQAALLARFLAAYASGDVAGLTSLLAADATLWSDGGASAHAARRPILGRDRILRFLFGVSEKLPPAVRWELRPVNGAPGVIGIAGDQVISVATFELSASAVTRIFLVVNPAKLAAIPVSAVA